MLLFLFTAVIASYILLLVCALDCADDFGLHRDFTVDYWLVHSSGAPAFILDSCLNSRKMYAAAPLHFDGPSEFPIAPSCHRCQHRPTSLLHIQFLRILALLFLAFSYEVSNVGRIRFFFFKPFNMPISVLPSENDLY